MSLTETVARLFGIRGARVREAPPPQPPDARGYSAAAKVDLWPLNGHEFSVLFWGREVAYCGREPGAPVCFLNDVTTGLSHRDKVEIVKHILREVGDVRVTPQTAKVIEEAKREASLAR